FISGFDKAILATAPPPIFSLSFSATSPFIACGDGWGNVYVFQLPTHFTSESDGDQSILEAVARIQSGSF
ncbi:MAG: hypothetical protein EZS28_056247, partial [Streblomastix strix]